MASDKLYLHGRMWLSDRNSTTGKPGNFVEMPDTVDLELNLETSDVEFVSKAEPIASLDLSIPYMIKGNGKMTVASSLGRVIANALYGTETAVAGGVFTDQEFPSGISEGDILPIPGDRTHISSLVLTDSAMSPATLTLDTDYFLEDIDAGLVRFGDISTFTEPILASGEETAGSGVGVFQQRVVEKYLRFKGFNIADEDAIKVIDFYRIQMSPTASWKVLGDGGTVQQWEMAFKLLKDSMKPRDATFGQFARYRE